MTPRTPHLVVDAVLFGAVIVLWRAVHDAATGLQHMANVYADHQCPREVHVSVPDLPRPTFVAGHALVQPPPMQDPAIARSPITLGGPK